MLVTLPCLVIRDTTSSAEGVAFTQIEHHPLLGNMFNV